MANAKYQRPLLWLRGPVDLDGAPGFVGGVAKILQRAIGAFRTPCDAQRAAVQDDLVREEDPLVTRDHVHQVPLDLLRIGVSGQLQTVRNALHVRIDDHTVRDLVPGAQHDIGGLARDPRHGQQLVHGARDLAAKFADDLARRPYQRLRLIAKEAGGADIVLELLRLERRKRLWSGIFLEQNRRDHVDAYIGALSREDGGHQ